MGTISGTVTSSGSAVQGATVAVVDSNGWTVAGTDTTDANGAWAVGGLDGGVERYHALVQYDDGSQFYNAESLPFLTVEWTLSPAVTPAQVAAPTPSISTGSAIPDVSMFQSPIYQWNAQAGIGVADGQEATSWDDQLASLTASAVGNPFYRADQGGFEAVELDGTDDGYDYPSDGQLPTGDSAVSFAATLWAKAQHTGTITLYGNAASTESAEIELRSDGVVRVVSFGSNIAETTATYPTGQWITVGGRLSSAEFAAFLNGGNKGTAAGETMNFQDANRSIGYSGYDNATYGDYYLYDLVVCAAAESDQAFSDYHNDRLG